MTFPLPTLSILRCQSTVLRVVLGWLLLATSWAAADTEVSRTVSATPNGSVEIETTSGSIRIEGWDQESVNITGSLGEDVEELVVESDGNRVSIEVVSPDHGSWRNRDIDADLLIQLPNRSRVEVETVSASIEVEDFDGQLEAESVSGSIGVKGQLKSADLESVSGSIRVAGPSTRTFAETVSGSVRLTDISGRVEASSVSGGIEVRAGSVDRGDFESVSGSVEVDCSPGAESRLELSSHSGSVTITVPANVSASFEASSFSGRIENDFGQQPTRESKWVPSKSLEFEVGGGSAEISLEAFSGNVRIRRR